MIQPFRNGFTNVCWLVYKQRVLPEKHRKSDYCIDSSNIAFWIVLNTPRDIHLSSASVYEPVSNPFWRDEKKNENSINNEDFHHFPKWRVHITTSSVNRLYFVHAHFSFSSTKNEKLSKYIIQKVIQTRARARMHARTHKQSKWADEKSDSD